MSLTAIVWLCMFVFLAVMTMRRSSWGIPLYMITFFANPPLWWWGRGVLSSFGHRWNLVAALILAVGVLFDIRRRSDQLKGPARNAFLWLLLYAINALFIHLLAAANVENSATQLSLIWKQTGLLLLMWLTIQDEFDLKMLIYSIILGTVYVGYEVVINDQGHFSRSRLEGINLPGADESNFLACLFCLSLPLIGGLLLAGKRHEQVAALLCAPLVVEVVLRCNSRGAFLSLILAVGWLVVGTFGKMRRRVLAVIAVGAIGTFMMISDQDILDRFYSTFAEGTQRDRSAQSRIEFWMLALDFITDHPFGAGGEAAFKSDLGLTYLAGIGEIRYRAVHNGYLDIAASWGVQGTFVYAMAFMVVWRNLRKAIRAVHARDDDRTALLGTCIDAALVTQLFTGIFLSSLDSEWIFWWFAVALAYHRVHVVKYERELDAAPWEEDDWLPTDEDDAEEPILLEANA